jgi:hypothetical protein
VMEDVCVQNAGEEDRDPAEEVQSAAAHRINLSALAVWDGSRAARYH